MLGYVAPLARCTGAASDASLVPRLGDVTLRGNAAALVGLCQLKLQHTALNMFPLVWLNQQQHESLCGADVVRARAS